MRTHPTRSNVRDHFKYHHLDVLTDDIRLLRRLVEDLADYVDGDRPPETLAALKTRAAALGRKSLTSH